MSGIEEMSAFFEKRIDGYDEHMLSEVVGCKEGYKLMAENIPIDAKNLLDLGCGTGLELDEIFKIRKSISVVGIDLSEAMLKRLKGKHPDKDLVLISDDYFKVDFGKGKFDAVVSFETMHHFTRDEKIKLYKKIKDALKENAIYIECDYMAENDDEESKLLSEREKLLKENNANAKEYYHIDIPYTFSHQTEMLVAAGFSEICKIFKLGGTVMLIAK